MLSEQGILDFVRDWRANVAENFAKDRGKDSGEMFVQLQKTLAPLVEDDDDLLQKFHRWIENYEGSRNPQVWMFRKHLSSQKQWDAQSYVNQPSDSTVTSLSQLSPEQIAKNRERIRRMKGKLKGLSSGTLTKEALAARGVEQKEEIVQLTGVELEDMGEEIDGDDVPW